MGEGDGAIANVAQAGNYATVGATMGVVGKVLDGTGVTKLQEEQTEKIKEQLGLEKMEEQLGEKLKKQFGHNLDFGDTAGGISGKDNSAKTPKSEPKTWLGVGKTFGKTLYFFLPPLWIVFGRPSSGWMELFFRIPPLSWVDTGMSKIHPLWVMPKTPKLDKDGNPIEEDEEKKTEKKTEEKDSKGTESNSGLCKITGSPDCKCDSKVDYVDYSLTILQYVATGIFLLSLAGCATTTLCRSFSPVGSTIVTSPLKEVIIHA